MSEPGLLVRVVGGLFLIGIDAGHLFARPESPSSQDGTNEERQVSDALKPQIQLVGRLLMHRLKNKSGN